MTNNEIHQILQNTSALSCKMDKQHIKRLYSILTNAHDKSNGAFFLFIDIRKEVRKILSDLIKMDHVNNVISCKKMKQIYTVLGDYEFYPICKLCGQPITIDTYTLKHEKQADLMSFTWDHVKPKSMGGSWDLANLQPTHKICNAKRGVKPAYKKTKVKNGKSKYKITIAIQIQETPDLEKRYRPSHFGLRKQDAWCHKCKCRCYGA